MRTALPVAEPVALLPPETAFFGDWANHAPDRNGIVRRIPRSCISADNIPVDGRTRSAGFADRYVIAVLSSRFCSAVNPRPMRRVR